MAKLENKTREISEMLNNLNKITSPATPVKRKTDQKPSAKSDTPDQSDDRTEAKKDCGESSDQQK